MVREIPATLPPLRALLADIDQAPARLARTLGVSLRTLQRWQAAGQAPRAATVALYLLSRWGRSAAECDAANGAALAHALAESYRRERDALRRELARVVALGRFDSANAPTVQPLPLGLVPAPLPRDPVSQAGQRADDDRAHDGAAHDKQAFA